MLRHPTAALLAVACVISFSPDVRAQEARPGDGPHLEVQAGELQATDVIEQWAALTAQVVTIDPQLQPIRLRFTTAARLDARTLRHVLDFNDIILVERDGMLQAHHRRNLSQKVGPPWDLIEGLAPDDDRLVTSVVSIRHGAGNAIFATMRGLLMRDTNRIGNILYVQGSEVIVVCDLAANVRYYQDVIAALDRPPPVARARSRVAFYEVRRAAWAAVQKGEPTAERRAAALRASSADADGGVVLLAEGMFDGSEPVSFDRGTQAGAERTRLTVEVGVPTSTEGDGTPESPRRLVSGSASAGLHLRLSLEIVSNDQVALSLRSLTRFAAAGSTVLYSFSGRGGAQPTDVIVVLE